MKRWFLTFLTLFLTCALFCVNAEPAAAQSEQERKQAQDYFEKGAEWYTQGEYSKAIVEFLKGYNTAPNAMFLYNISLSYGKLNNWEDALAAAEKARTEEGMPDNVVVRNDARIAAFRTTLLAQKINETKPAVAEVPTETPKEKTQESGFGALGWTGVVLTVAGAGLGVGAFVVASGVQSDIDDYEAAAANGDREAYDQLRSDIESGQSTGQILMYSGIGLGVAGLTMIAIELFSGEESDNHAVWAAPTSSGAAVGYHLRF